MSGHSKWAKLKHTKGASDAKKSKIFSRMANMITLATRQGKSGDPRLNFVLRDAIAKARAENLPQDNIERAIKRGLGQDDGAVLEEITFEAYGPAGVALLVSCITDKRNRTLGELKQTLNAAGGRFGEKGTVMWMFKEVGKVTVTKASWNGNPDIELACIEAGASAIDEEDDTVIVTVPKTNLESVRSACENAGAEAQTSMEYEAQNPVHIDDEQTRQDIETLMEQLSDLDDVQDVYTNADF